jgi:hypothetical protein
MPDDLAFVGLKGAFALGIKGGCQRCRIGTALADRRPEKLENIIVPETSKPIAAATAVLQLTERRQRQATAGNHCDQLYCVFFPQALMNQINYLLREIHLRPTNVMISKVSNFRYFLVSIML